MPYRSKESFRETVRPDRRTVIAGTTAGLLGVGLLGRASARADSPACPSADRTAAASQPGFQEAEPAAKNFVPNRIAISTYSFWRYRDDSKFTIPHCIELAAEMGFDGVEILHVQMEKEDRAYLQELKRRAFVNGLDLCGFSTHQGFVSPDREVREENVKKTLHQIELAYEMGIPTMRVNTGRWGTIRSFDKLMEAKGIEPRLEGYSDDQGFEWVIDSFGRCVDRAKECGVVLGLENHWGLGISAEGVLRVVEAIDSPWFKVTMDTGNLFERRHEQLEKMAPHAVLIQAKTYFGGGTWYTLEIDYPAVAKITQAAGYRGYVSLEFEGKEDYRTAIPKSLNLLRDAFGTNQLS